jgi:two-component system sporulation sensor kinase A
MLFILTPLVGFLTWVSIRLLLERRSSKRLVRDLNGRLTAQKQELERLISTAALGEAAAHAAHDIRSPLSVISLLSRKSGDADSRALLEQAIERMNKVAEELLTLRRTLMAPTEGGPLLCNIKFCVQSVIDVKLMSGGKRVSFSIWGEDLWLTWSRLELIRVLTVLIDNSVDAVDFGGSVDVGVFCDAESIKISVRDDGMGFPKGFSLENPLSTKPNGNALGLKHVNQVMRALGGSVAISSSGEIPGATVALEFPLNLRAEFNIQGTLSSTVHCAPLPMPNPAPLSSHL